MTTPKTWKIWAAALCGALAVAGCAASSKQATSGGTVAAPPPSGTVGQNMVTATATVKKLDLKKRLVTLERVDGSVFTFRAGEEVRNLAQVKVGDTVTVTYYESLAYQVRRAGEAEPGAAVAEEVGRAKLGEKPGAAGARVTTLTATITAIDKAAGTVTIRGPEGDSVTIKARDPRNLDRVAVGDLVDITYTEAVAVSVEEPAKK